MLRIVSLFTVLLLTESTLLYRNGHSARESRLSEDSSEDFLIDRRSYSLDNLADIEQDEQNLLIGRREAFPEEDGERLKLIKKVATNDVSSITTLGGKLFTLDTISHRISVYNAQTYEHVRDITLSGFTDPKDIVACSATNSLYLHEYLIDFQGNKLVNRSGIIWRTSIDWKLKFKWKVWKAGPIVSSSISVNDYNGNVLLAEGDQFKPDLVMYRPDGSKLKLIRINHLISSDQYFIWHAVQSRSSGNIMISYNTVDGEGGSKYKQWHGVIEISGSGKQILNSFGNVIQPNSLTEPDGLGYPWQLATDKRGSVFVVDRWRNLLVALPPGLSKEETYINNNRGIPLCLWLDFAQNLLLVGVYRGLETYSEIYVYEIKK